MPSLKEPFYYPGSTVGCLLIHGFTSTPAEMRVIGEMLAAHGYTSKGILLPGHGTQPEDLMEVTYKDWINAAQAGINELKKTCQKIVVIGHSMGGLLALQMAARNKVDGVVTIAAAIKPSNRKAHLAWLFKHFKPFVAGANKERPAEQRKYLLHYPYFPVASVAELMRLAAHTRSILHQITASALIIQTQDDQTVRPESAQIIHKTISSRHKECLWLEEGTHNVPVVSPYNEQIVQKIIDFIERPRAS
ncbi:MAG: alpha/beta fold hydrolase [Firmicutes bacterium]|jgi:carboxylesterase|nr:alpha/beta fold hydrolase [Bacillota bacterium]NLO65736.1 alpha/beta fold hydrolase [Bacillota bacterium]